MQIYIKKHIDTQNKYKQVLNPQKGVSGTHSFKLIHIYIAPMVNSWRSEVGSVDGLQNSTLGLVFGIQYSTIGGKNILLSGYTRKSSKPFCQIPT